MRRAIPLPAILCRGQSRARKKSRQPLISRRAAGGTQKRDALDHELILSCGGRARGACVPAAAISGRRPLPYSELASIWDTGSLRGQHVTDYVTERGLTVMTVAGTTVVRRRRGGIEASGVVAAVGNRRAGRQIGAELLRVSGRRGGADVGGNADEVNLVVARGGDEEDGVIG